MNTATLSVRPAFSTIAALAFFSLSSIAASAQSAKSIFPLLPPSVSTIPSNGDLNPYGVAFAPKNVPTTGVLQPGDILVSNFNDSNNLQGTGSTIVRVDKTGKVSTFFTSSKHGLTAALGVLSDGLVLSGNLPTADGTAATVQPGQLSIIDHNGNFLGNVGTGANVNGPWGMAVYDTGNGVTGSAHVWISNVLSGTVSRFDLIYNAGEVDANVITLATGFTHRTDAAALVLGPTGLVYDPIHDILYVASSTDNAVYQIPTAAAAHSTVSASLFFQDPEHLHGPLDLSILPNGHFLVANSDGSNVDPNQPSELVEYSGAGVFLNQMPVDPNNGGAFGLSTYNLGWGTFRLAAVDDNANSLNIWTTIAQ
jgi:hypothetical protein